MLFEDDLRSEIRRRCDPELKSKEPLDRVDSGQRDEDSVAELIRLRKEVAELRTGA